MLHIRVALDVQLDNATHGQALDIDDSGSLDAEEFCNSIKNLVLFFKSLMENGQQFFFSHISHTEIRTKIFAIRKPAHT